MSLIRRIFKGVVGHYSYENSYLTQLIEEEKKHQYLKELIEISDRIIEKNPNFIDEVKKSETGCWMDQLYGTHKCPICDFIDDCPIKLESDWQDFLKEQAALRQAQSEQYASNEQNSSKAS
ncbi:MAG: hypothetical protein HGB19_03830 [Chlorobiales bacterium]|nr:hypothetical protein [Chlorobiales bacterium]